MSKYSFRLWILLASDVDRPIGGVKQIYRFSEACMGLGVRATVIQQTSDFSPAWFNSSAPTISFSEFNSLKLSPLRDFLVIPETTIASVDSIRPELRRIIFNQNSSYTFGLGDTNIINPRSLLNLYQQAIHTFVISQYDYNFISSLLSIDKSFLSLLINPIEVDLFTLPAKKRRQIAYMPRKNQKHSLIVTSFLKAHPSLQGWGFIPIHKMNQVEVASVLRQSCIFLSFGHPEGFGLPVAEALASGCTVIGYSGIGGNELFELGDKYSCAYSIPFGDFLSFISTVVRIVSDYETDFQSLVSNNVACSSIVRKRYCALNFANSIKQAFDKIEAVLPSLFLSANV